MESGVYFENQFTSQYNVGRPVGFDPDNVLVLTSEGTDNWGFDPVPSDRIQAIHVRKFRSPAAIVFGLIAAALALFIAYLGIIREITGLGVYTIPVVAGGFAYFLLTGSRCVRIEFKRQPKSLVYKSRLSDAYRESLAALRVLQGWADRHKIAMNVGFPLAPEPMSEPKNT